MQFDVCGTLYYNVHREDGDADDDDDDKGEQQKRVSSHKRCFPSLTFVCRPSSSFSKHTAWGDNDHNYKQEFQDEDYCIVFSSYVQTEHKYAWTQCQFTKIQ